ncbi:MAG: hypothetical protein WC405_02340 [Syntrophales bacterium]
MWAKIGILGMICVFALSIVAACAIAQESWPDMKGVWSMTSSTVVLGTEKHHPGKVKQETPRYREVNFTLRITEQKDRRFSGTVESVNYKETVIGVFANNRNQILMADSDGYFDATLIDANTIDYCYRHISSGSTVVACSVMKRDRK